MKINDKIRPLREINNLTQEDMANQLHMSTNGYANIERGETKINTDKLGSIVMSFQSTKLNIEFAQRRGKSPLFSHTLLRSPANA